MKKVLSIIMALALNISLAACGQTQNSGAAEESVSQTASENAAAGQETQSNNSENDSNILVAYFSWSGNTREMASYIAQQTGGELFEILPETPYPTDYSECGEVAQRERDNNERPAISDLPESVSQYDAIIIGYPIWWHTAPMIIGTFLENYDLTGIDIYPFAQSSSMDTEQFNNSVDFVRENAGGATVHEGLFARPSDTQSIDSYLSENGLAL